MSKLVVGDISQAKSYVLRLLALRQRSVGELKTKMCQKGYDDGTVNQVLQYLVGHRLVDDYQYSIQLINGMLNRSRPVGKHRIRQELKKRQISREIIEELTSDLDDADELVRAQQLVDKTLKNSNKEYSWQRTASLLQRQGFSYDIIRKILDDLD